MNQNYLFFMKSNVDKFMGQWVAISHQKIVSHGKNPKDVFKDAIQKCPDERPFLAKVPEKKMMIF